MQAVELKNYLVSQGLVMNQDFEWHYRKAYWDDFSGEAVRPQHAEFVFRDPVLATFYQLRWSKHNY